MCPNIEIGVSQNINKYSEKMDVIVNVQQSKFLNKLWYNNIFTNAEKTFFFKLHSNILGYNSMVAHFVRGHSPNCNFCDINETAVEHIETPLHLFFNCDSVSNIIDSVMDTITGEQNFLYSQREFLTTFDRRDYSFAKNLVLTYVSKFIIKYIWDCRNRKVIPTIVNCREVLAEKINVLKNNNTKFNKLWTVSNLNNLQ
jgi:hypothetical protein